MLRARGRVLNQFFQKMSAQTGRKSAPLDDPAQPGKTFGNDRRAASSARSLSSLRLPGQVPPENKSRQAVAHCAALVQDNETWSRGDKENDFGEAAVFSPCLQVSSSP
jgi:hypothetical protein